MLKRLVVFMVVGCTVFLSGCWDTLDVERNGFVLGVGIDLAEDEDNIFKMTLQIAIPANRSTQMDAGGGGDDKPYVNRVIKGDSMLAMTRKAAQQTSRDLSYDHLKVLVISDQIAKKQNMFSSVLDFYIRDMEMRRNIKMLISGGKDVQAKNILEVAPSLEKLPSLYIDGVAKNADLTLRMSPQTLIGDVEGFVLQDFSYILPHLEKPAEDHLNDAGAAVFGGTQDKMVGTLTPEEVFGLNLMRQKNKDSVIKFQVEGHQMTYELDYGNPQMDINPDHPEKMNINITIHTEGKVAEMFGGKSMLQKQYVEEIQAQLTDRIEQFANNTVDKLQNDLKTDVINISQQLDQKHPDVWKKIRDDWELGEQYFTNADIQVKATAEIQEIGATDQTKDKRESE